MTRRVRRLIAAACLVLVAALPGVGWSATADEVELRFFQRLEACHDGERVAPSPVALPLTAVAIPLAAILATAAIARMLPPGRRA